MPTPSKSGSSPCAACLAGPRGPGQDHLHVYDVELSPPLFECAECSTLWELRFVDGTAQWRRAQPALVRRRPLLAVVSNVVSIVLMLLAPMLAPMGHEESESMTRREAAARLAAARRGRPKP